MGKPETTRKRSMKRLEKSNAALKLRRWSSAKRTQIEEVQVMNVNVTMS